MALHVMPTPPLADEGSIDVPAHTIPTGTLFEGWVGGLPEPGRMKHVYLRAFSGIIDLTSPANTYSHLGDLVVRGFRNLDGHLVFLEGVEGA